MLPTDEPLKKGERVRMLRDRSHLGGSWTEVTPGTEWTIGMVELHRFPNEGDLHPYGLMLNRNGRPWFPVAHQEVERVPVRLGGMFAELDAEAAL